MNRQRTSQCFLHACTKAKQSKEYTKCIVGGGANVKQMRRNNHHFASIVKKARISPIFFISTNDAFRFGTKVHVMARIYEYFY